jgi:hypothetical protein
MTADGGGPLFRCHSSVCIRLAEQLISWPTTLASIATAMRMIIGSRVKKSSPLEGDNSPWARRLDHPFGRRFNS